MTDDITIAGGGTLAVATAELFENCERLGRLRTMLTDCATDLDTVNSRVTRENLRAVDAPLSSIRAEEALDDTVELIRRAAPTAYRVQFALIASAEAYGAMEYSIAQLSQSIAAQFGGLFGRLLPFFALAVLPATISLGVGAAAGISLLPPALRARVIDALPAWLLENSAPLSDPRVVQLIRLSAMSVDDVGGGLLMLPPEIIMLVGDEGFGLVGLATSAGLLVSLARPTGIFAETPVAVARVGSGSRVSPVEGFTGRAERIPQAVAQVRIDRYEAVDAPDRFEVYIGGTRDFGVVAAGEPWDMTSNLNSVAGRESGASSAVRQAMADAGIDASSAVVFTGHSQGGLIAAQLAASGDFDTKGLFTLGAPVGQVEVPSNVPWVAIEHTDDLVPATGGTWASSDPVLVRRQYFAGRELDLSVVLPAHQLDSYRETTHLVDASTEKRLVRARAAMDCSAASAAGAAGAAGAAPVVTSTLYRATRGANR